MVEMTEAAGILNNASARSLVLIDEIGRGTSTFDGLALAYAIARHLAENVRCWTLFATHYFELTQLAAELPQVANVHLDAVEHKDRIVFLHRLEAGPADRSYGLQVAALAGVPREVIKAARRHLGELESHMAPTVRAGGALRRARGPASDAGRSGHRGARRPRPGRDEPEGSARGALSPAEAPR